MIDVYHCPKCSRLLQCEGVVAVDGHELPVFSCEDCVVRKKFSGLVLKTSSSPTHSALMRLDGALIQSTFLAKGTTQQVQTTIANMTQA
jgi:hypothetical protein